ncbi:MAG TPA: carbon-nitrogen hydrolase [Gammaproteobacteria bacterium]|nr:carbon-nitrogen hydrolase [Gammaproteobacteria bacterium]
MTASRSVRVGLVQMACDPDPAGNLDKALRLARQAATKGAQIVCLPEMYRSRYFCQIEDHAHFELAEPVPGPSSDAFGRLAAELDLAIIVPIFEKRAAGLYHNSALVIDGGRGEIGMYRKMHIPDDPRFYEKFYFTPGDLGFKKFPTRHADVGVLICWDQWYPEAARLTALQGAQILFYPTAIGWQPAEKAEYGRAQHDSWEVIQRAHAIANGCFVAAVNRIGFEPDPAHAGQGIEFWGQSFIAAPDGSILTRAPADKEAVIVQSLDLTRLDFSRTHWPFLRDRRIDAYGGLTRRFLD